MFDDIEQAEVPSGFIFVIRDLHLTVGPAVAWLEARLAGKFVITCLNPGCHYTGFSKPRRDGINYPGGQKPNFCS